MMGWEGVFGILITLCIIVPSQYFGCPFKEDQCINGHIDDMGLAFYQLAYSKTILQLSICFVLCAAAFNGFGTFATKLTSASNRAVVEQSRVIVVWVFFLLFTGVGHEQFSLTKVAGFQLILLGVIFFNKILVIDGCSIRFMPKEEETKPLSPRKEMPIVTRLVRDTTPRCI